MGASETIAVNTVVVSNGPSNPVDAEVTVQVDAPEGVVITETTVETVPDLDSKPADIDMTLSIECEEMGVYEVDITSSIVSSDAVYDDPVMENNTQTAMITVYCKRGRGRA